TGDVVDLAPEEPIREHAPLVTVLRYGRKSRQVELPVMGSRAFTEVGTLGLGCESRSSDHRGRLHFQLRGAADDVTFDDGDAAEAAASETRAGAACVVSHAATCE